MALVRITRADGTVDTIFVNGSVEKVDVQDGAKVEIVDEPEPAAAAEKPVLPEFGVDRDDELFVVQVTDGTDFLNGSVAGDGVNPVGMIGITGAYGTLFMFSNGVYEYDLNRMDPRVRALGEDGRLSDAFSYAVSDRDGVFDTSTLVIEIAGTRAGPRVCDDDNTVDDMMANDMLAALREQPSADDGGSGLKVLGHTGGDRYGTLTLNTDGSYGYQLDEANSDVSALGEGETLTELYTYAVTDGVNTDTATLTVTITGVKNGPATVSATHQLNTVVCEGRRRT